MGLRFRKSIRIGKYFRINVSKSGIGYSYGIKGIRRTISATGKKRTTFSIPKTGISYTVNDNNNKNSKRQLSRKKTPQNTIRPNKYNSINNLHINTQSAQENNGLGETQSISSSSINCFQDSDFAGFINQLKNSIKLDILSNVVIIFGLLFILISRGLNKYFFFLAIVYLLFGIIFKLYVRMGYSNKIQYDFDEDSLNRYNKIREAVLSLNKSKKIWQVLAFNKVTNKKIHAGADQVISRKNIRISLNVPFYLRSNISPPSIPLISEKLYFLPDVILIIKGTSIGTISYSDFSYHSTKTVFIEEDAIPNDTKIVGYTWKYVNKNGNPDKRFNNNRKIPECEYGVLRLSSSKGLNVEIQTSNANIALGFNI